MQLHSTCSVYRYPHNPLKYYKMSQVTYTTENFTKLTPIYPYDEAAELKQYDFYSDEQLNFNFSQMLSGVSDVKVNNFSKLFLTKKKKLSDFFKSSTLTDTPNAFSTYFSFNAIQGNTERSFFWAVDEDTAIGHNSLRSYIEPATELANRHFFDIIFLTPMLCKVTHEAAGLLRYLTLDYTYNLAFAPDLGYDVLGDTSPQVFYYFYDTSADLIILYKKIRDYPYYVTYNPNTRRIALRQPPLGPALPFNLNGVMRVRPHNEPADAYDLNEQRVTYAKDFATALNTVSAEVANNNYLVHTEFRNITGSSFDVNILTLKNELTPDHNNALPGEIFVSNQYVERDYARIFSGTSEVHGDDNISFGYKGFTKALTFNPDAVTYFHVPQDIYPYSQLNVNDTNLYKCGAIASDHPVKADKIFKKRSTYASTSPYGESTEEASGQFLCAWLSGSANSNTKPVWVDRYYNPQRTTLLEALTGATLNTYVTQFETVVSSTSSTATIFDKPSDLFFAPGNYYAYHHIGNSDVVNYLKTLTTATVQNSLVNFYSHNSPIFPQIADVTEFPLSGAQYSTSVSLSSIISSNRFTIAFDLYNADWQVPFANQIVGNFLNDGLGLFYTNYITPFLYFFSGNILRICNTAGKEIDIITFEDTIAALLRHENMKNYYVVLTNGKILQLTPANTVVGAVVPFVSGATVLDCFYDSASAAVLMTTESNEKRIALFNFHNNTLNEITTVSVLSTTSLVASPTAITDYDYIIEPNLPLTECETIAFYNNVIYCIPGHRPAHLDGSVLYLNIDFKFVVKLDLATETLLPFFSSTSAVQIRDFTIDRTGNFWLVSDEKIYAYSSTRDLKSVTTYNNGSRYPVSIDFVRELTAEGQQYYGIVCTQNNFTPGDTTLQMHKINSAGEITETIIFDDFFSNLLRKQNIANGDFSRRVIDRTDSTLNAKIVVNNIINSLRQEYNLFVPTSGIGFGYHNIAMRFDALKGSFALFFDGIKVDEAIFLPGQYTFSKTLDRPLTIGATPFYNQTLPQYLAADMFYVNNCTMKNFVIYKEALNDSDLTIIANSSKSIPAITYNVPAGQRSFVDEIERYFKLDVPSLKATNASVAINAGNIPGELRDKLQARIENRLAAILPHYSRLNIKWVDNSNDDIVTYTDPGSIA